MSFLLKDTWSRYAMDAWNRPKVYQDFSLFSATWTFGIPGRVWEEETCDVSGPSPVITYQTGFPHATSEDGILAIVGAGPNDGSSLRSKKYMRYQPNRGHLYSTAVIVDNPSSNGHSAWGLGSTLNEISFRCQGDGTDWDIKAYREKNNVVVSDISIKDAILEKIPDFDPSKGHVYDIQFEWRGVGNYYFFVDLQLVYTMDLLGTLDGLSITDPAFPVMYAVLPYDQTATNDMKLRVGCVDVSSEGGSTSRTLFGTVDTGDSQVAGAAAATDNAILAIQVPRTVDYNSVDRIFSRGAIMDKLVTWTRDEALTKVYHLRDIHATNLFGIADNADPTLGWAPIPDSLMKQMVGGVGTLLDTSFALDKATGIKVVQQWADIEAQNVITNPSTNSDFDLVPGDILVVVINCIGNAKKTSASLYYSEEL